MKTIEAPASETDRRGSRRPSTGRAPLALLAAILLGGGMFASKAEAQVTTLPINKCLSGKINGVGKSLEAHSRCLAKETSTGVGAPKCHQKASDTFTGGIDPTTGLFNKLELKYPIAGSAPCLTFADQDSFEDLITSYAASMGDISGSGVGKCDAAKIKCVGKYVAAGAGCAAKGAGKNGMVDSACTGKASTKLADGATGCLDKAALKTGCTHVGSQAAVLQGAADVFLQQGLCTLVPGSAGCTSTTTTLTDPSTTTSTTATSTSTTIPPDTTTTTSTTSTTLASCAVPAPPALAAGTFIRYTRGELQLTHDVTIYGDPEVNALSNSDAAVFDASNFIDPAVCDSTAADLTFHWEINYPPAATITNPYTVAGITGYRKARLEIGSNTLIAQSVPPVDFKLTVVSKLTGLSTTVHILSQVSESSLTLTVFNSCKGQAVACDECICTIAAALPTTEPT